MQFFLKTHFICCSCCFKAKLVETRDCKFSCSSGCRPELPTFHAACIGCAMEWFWVGWGGVGWWLLLQPILLS